MTAIEKFRNFYQGLSKKDISGLSDVYSHNIEFIDPIATHHGIETVTQYFGRLLKGTSSCDFTIHSIKSLSDDEFVAEWQMRFVSSSLKTDNPIVVDGITVAKTEGDYVTYHRDYYDMGQLAYEHVPLLGYFVRKVKGKLQ